MGGLIDGLGVNGSLVIVGASAEPFAVSSFQLLMARKSIVGWPSGTAMDLGGHAQIRRGQRHPTDDRDLSAGAGR